MSARYCVTTCKFACANNTPCPDLVKANNSFPNHINFIVAAQSAKLSDEFKLGFPLASKPTQAPGNEIMTTDSIVDAAPVTTDPPAPVKRRGGFEKGRKLGKRKPKTLPPDGTPVIATIHVSEPAGPAQPTKQVPGAS